MGRERSYFSIFMQFFGPKLCRIIRLVFPLWETLDPPLEVYCAHVNKCAVEASGKHISSRLDSFFITL